MSHKGMCSQLSLYCPYKFFLALKNVYYIVYNKDWTKVTVYDNKLKAVDNFVPLYVHE
jgi:hypothetical protein